MDSNYTCSSEVLTKSSLPVGVSEKVTHGTLPLLLPCNPALPGRSQHTGAVPHYMDDIYLVGTPEKMPDVISSLQKSFGSVNFKFNTNKSRATTGT